MNLDEKIRNRRVTYLLKSERPLAFELAILYYILAKRRTAHDKIADACLKSIQWLNKAEIKIPEILSQLELADQLDLIEQILVDNTDILPEKQAGVGARRYQVAFDRPAINLAAGGIGLVPQYK